MGRLGKMQTALIERDHAAWSNNGRQSPLDFPIDGDHDIGDVGRRRILAESMVQSGGNPRAERVFHVEGSRSCSRGTS